MTQLTFLGAARVVTGSRTLLTHNGYTICIDCGLFQGPKELREMNWNICDDLKKVQKVILTHAHIDHSGLIPRLVKEGFTGEILCTEATYELCKVLLTDSGRLHEEDAFYANKTGHSKHKPALPLYTEKDAINSLKYFRPIKFKNKSPEGQKQWAFINPEIQFCFLNAGHILGSSFVEIELKNTSAGNGDNSITKKITFSGDLGNSKSPIQMDPDPLPESDILVLESTYGDRLHPSENILAILERIIETVLGRGGTLIIPAFALGRTQEIIHYIRELELTKRIKTYPVYLDSPMAQSVTQIYEEFPDQLNTQFRNNTHDHYFETNNFNLVGDHEASERLSMDNAPKIVISASGMVSGGRVIHHLKSHLSNPLCGVLFVGYQAEGTKGRLIKDGIPRIRLHHQEIPIHASIYSIDSLSAHADLDGILGWVKTSPSKPKRIFLNHGETGPLESLKYSLINECDFSNIDIPKLNETFEI